MTLTPPRRPRLKLEDNIKAILKKAYARMCKCIHARENGEDQWWTRVDRVVKCSVY